MLSLAAVGATVITPLSGGPSAAASLRPLAAATTAAAPAGGTLSVDQAIAQAQTSGEAVSVPGSTTATTDVTANPDGSITSNTFLEPVRKRVNSTWKPLDATLQRNADGSISPAVTTVNLAFGAQGSTRLATQGSGPNTFGLNLPFALPQPVLSGSTATYLNVLSGVDLVVTADRQGGFSEVFVVKSSAAASNPSLSALTLSVSSGLTVSTDTGSNIAVSNAAGTVLATAPTPLMWDSAAPSSPPATTKDAASGQTIDSATGLPATSSSQEAGEGAHVAKMATSAQGGTLKLTPDKSLLTSTSTTWPVYLDPTWSDPHIGGNDSSWATVRSDYPDTSYVKTSDPLRVGDQAWDSPYYTARSFAQFALGSGYYGSTVNSARVTVSETYAPSCTAKEVDLYHSGYITSGVTWAHPPAKNALAGKVTAAHGYNASCTPADVKFSDSLSDSTHPLTDIMQTGANASWSKVAFGLYAHDENDKYGWKKFDNNSVSILVNYNHTPTTPTTSMMGTSPKTTLSTSSTCATPPTGMTTVGKGDITFTITGKDPDRGLIGLGYGLFKTSTNTQIAGTSSSSTSYMVTSGTTFNWKVDESILDGQAKDSSGAAAPTDFYWRTHIYDGNSYSDWSPYCHFIYDPGTIGPPNVIAPTTPYTVGTPTTFTIHQPASGAVPISYKYNLNGATDQTVTASSGTATISVTPTRIFGNVLTVFAVYSGGIVGSEASIPKFDAAVPPTYADNDLTGDTVPDQLTVGAATGTPAPGLWLAKGTGTAGAFTTATTNVGTGGIGGAGAPTPGSPTEFNGGKAITGLFSGGSSHGSPQDQLIFFPTTGTSYILPGNGDGTLRSISSTTTVPAFTNDAGNNPTQVVNAGNTSGRGLDFPDLLATESPTGSGLALYLVPNDNNAGTYLPPIQLTSLTPTGSTDWTNWKLTSAQSTSTGTNLYLWNTSTKALYLWRSLSYIDNGDGTGQLTGNQYTVAASWNPSTVNTLEAADLNADGTTDLRTISTTGAATPYLVTGLPAPTALGTPGATAATVTTKPSQTLTW